LLGYRASCCSCLGQVEPTNLRRFDAGHAARLLDELLRLGSVFLVLGLVLGDAVVALLVHDGQVVARRREVGVAGLLQVRLRLLEVALDRAPLPRRQVHGRHAVAAVGVIALARLLEGLEALGEVLQDASALLPPHAADSNTNLLAANALRAHEAHVVAPRSVAVRTRFL